MKEYLNTMVVSLIDLRYRAKNAHWNCKGPAFYEFHLLFDRIYNEYEDLIDRLAERYVGASRENRVSGSIQEVYRETLLTTSQTSSEQASMFAKDLLDSVISVRQASETACEQAELEKDQSSLNILADVQEALDSHAFLLSSSLS